MITIKDLLTIYWSQVTLILIGLGYFVQRAFNLKAKKLEINHNLFQQRRLESVNSFFLNYSKVEQMWVHLSVHRILNQDLDAHEIDAMIFPPINELQKDVLQLQIYFDESEHILFKEIFQNVQSINTELMKIYFDEDDSFSSISKSNNFTSFRNKKLNANDLLFKKLSEELKRLFS